MSEAEALQYAVEAARAAQKAAEEAAASAAEPPGWFQTAQTVVALVLQGIGALVAAVIAGILIANLKTLSQRFNALTSLKFPGLELSFADRELGEAVAKRSGEVFIKKGTAEQYPVRISRRDEARALQRARRDRHLLDSARILWVDDHPENNNAERHVFEAFGARIDFVTYNAAALAALRGATAYDLVLSDIRRGDDKSPDGLELSSILRDDDEAPPLIFYIGVVDKALPLPDGAFALTNRPDELLQLALDALSRSASEDAD